jgi:hypothetical protein
MKVNGDRYIKYGIIGHDGWVTGAHVLAREILPVAPTMHATTHLPT